jgi:methyltransferase family protein
MRTGEFGYCLASPSDVRGLRALPKTCMDDTPQPDTAVSDPAVSVHDLQGEHAHHFLQRLHRGLEPSTYLEIGTYQGASLRLAECRSIAIDPSFALQAEDLVGSKPLCALFQMTSDEFFSAYEPDRILGDPIEFAFLDGMHNCEFLLRDFANTERHCRPTSVIALHDCVPVEVAMTTRLQTRERVESHRANWWAGDVWRTAVILKRTRPDLQMTVFDAAPTGMICVTHLDPSSTVLLDKYESLYLEMLSLDLGKFGVQRYHDYIGLESTSGVDTPVKLRNRLGLSGSPNGGV